MVALVTSHCRSVYFRGKGTIMRKIPAFSSLRKKEEEGQYSVEGTLLCSSAGEMLLEGCWTDLFLNKTFPSICNHLVIVWCHKTLQSHAGRSVSCWNAVQRGIYLDESLFNFADSLHYLMPPLTPINVQRDPECCAENCQLPNDALGGATSTGFSLAICGY